ncbi:terminase small subunit [Halodesulfovibrio sp.]|jgi:phage terminase small subunit|uniref:terminase small subunit n=1 Tax=Halodesulfovibrio sp. TaxID=1912772 RepID=UPI0025CC03FD|nr:terminase small subunit [Halodesulfovibrio sp.]MCT4534492.1 terminase small subunit [Halodesulfovibrio sp.]
MAEEGSEVVSVEERAENKKARKPAVQQKGAGKTLSVKQRRFVDEYLLDYNGRLAACRAGYAQKSAGATATRLLALPEIMQAISRKQAQRAQRTEITQDAVVRELAAVGFATLKDVCAWDDGHLTLRNSQDINSAQAASIAEITETVTSRGGTVRVKQHSKLKALEMLAKHVGLYDPPEVEHGTQSLEELSPVLKKRLEAIYGIITDDVKEPETVSKDNE